MITSGFNQEKRPGAARSIVWSIILATILVFAAHGEDAVYVVKPKDTLYGLARQNGISVRQLAERNRLERDAKLYVGQRLRIPGTGDDSASPDRTTPKLTATVQQAIDRAPVKSKRWKYIVIHHSGVDEGTVKGTDRFHREERHMENGMAYHFLIGNGHGMKDGEIGVGDRWKKQLDGGHLRSTAQNKVAIGICLVGNFDQHGPTAKQLDGLEALSKALMKRCSLGVAAVKTHKQINVVNTRCPGTKFPTKSFLGRLK